MIHCTVCGATLPPATSDLPFKVREHTIVIVKNLPVMTAKPQRQLEALPSLKLTEVARTTRCGKILTL